MRPKRREASEAALDPTDLQLPDFDARAARRAMWRGVVRTAFTAVLLVIVGGLLLDIVSGLWQTRGDREQRFQAVAGLGFLVAHPGWEGEPSGCCNTDITSMELFLDIWPQGASPYGERTRAWLRLDLLGRIDRESIPILPETSVDAALARGAPSKEATRELLDKLPQPVRALAIIELADPLSAPEFGALLRSHGVPTGEPGLHNAPPVFLEDPYPPIRLEGDRIPTVKLSWPNPQIASAAAGHKGELPISDPLTQFRSWAAMLQSGDDGNLERLGLPSPEYIKGLAEDPKLHGFLLERATIERLRGLLDDPRVRSANLADVTFDLSQSDEADL